MGKRGHVRRVLCIAVAAGWGACQPATQIDVEITTDVKCVDLSETQLVVGTLETLAGMPPAATTRACEGERIGNVVIVPGKNPADVVGLQVAVGVGQDTSVCLANGFKGGCIVARRALRFVERNSLTLPVRLEVDCIGVPCGATETCFRGGCVTAFLENPEMCSIPGGCSTVDGDASSPMDATIASDGAIEDAMHGVMRADTGSETAQPVENKDADGISDAATVDGPPKDPRVFQMDRTEVTVESYRRWLALGPSVAGQIPNCSQNNTFTPSCRWPPADNDQRPVVCVDWCDAYAYCKAQGQRLCGRIGGGATPFDDFASPATSQWFAMCSSGGKYLYSYGNVFNRFTCNVSGSGKGDVVEVGTFPGCKSPDPAYETALDLTGNVMEWEDSCRTLDDACRFRGGSFGSGANVSKCAADIYALRTFSGEDLGFRCCSEP